MTQAHKTYFKTECFRSKKYLAWIRTLQCAVCGAPAPCHPMHQSILGHASGSKKAPDNEVLPGCYDCHMIGEHAKGILTLWKTKRPEIWVSESNADPLKGLIYDKHDLREWIEIQCKAYFQLWENR